MSSPPGIFALLRTPRRRRGWDESVSAIPLLRGRQNIKIFFFSIEKNFGGARLKNAWKIFLFCSPKRSGGGRKCWAGLSPAGRTTCLPAGRSKVSVGILLKKGSDSAQKILPNWRRGEDLNPR